MSKSELTNSALEDENNWTEDSETLDDEYLSDFTQYIYEPCVSKESVKENFPENNHQILKKFKQD